MKKRINFLMFLFISCNLIFLLTQLGNPSSIAKEVTLKSTVKPESMSYDTGISPTSSSDSDIQPAILGFHISDLTKDGYIITCEASHQVSKVIFSAWTLFNGEDDLIKSQATKSKTVFSYYVQTKNHNYESGEYMNNIYAYDSSGNQIGFAMAQIYVSRPKPSVYDVQITEQSSLGFTVTCKILNPEAVDRIQFPTWTSANGQDDLVIEHHTNKAIRGTIIGDTVNFRVNDSEHNYEKGEYVVHIYTYDKQNNYTVHPLTYNLQNTFEPVNTATYLNKEYILMNDYLTWYDAKLKCEELGGYLLTINSQEEQDVIAELIRGQGRLHYWIGGHKVNNAFQWITDEPFIYANWSKGEPNSTEDNIGIEIYSTEGKDFSKWNDHHKHIVHAGFICERKITPITGITLNQTSLVLKTGENAELKAAITPESASNRPITWKSANTAVAFVTNHGLVIGLSPGFSVITAEAEGQMAYCVVQVSNGIDNLSSGNRLSLIENLLTLDDVKEIINNNRYPDWWNSIVN